MNAAYIVHGGVRSSQRPEASHYGGSGWLVFSCPSNEGTVGLEAFQVHLHRHRFEAIKKASNFTANHVFDHVTSISDVAPILKKFAAWHDCDALRAVSMAAKAFTSVVIDGKLYVVGGNDGHNALASAECFNLESGTWETIAPMPSAWGARSAPRTQEQDELLEYIALES